MDNNEIMLSIYVPVYNHEKYIVKTLDSVLMQKTQYTYEVLVGEDCSTDNTREILMNYEAQHPGKFKIYYRNYNMYKEKITNARDLRNRCIGKYVICLEGDDYWTDENKIEKQISFLENHPEYLAVAHNCVVVGKNSEKVGIQYQECKDNEYTIEHFCNDILPGQTATLMARNFFRDDLFDKSLISKKLIVGDRPIYFSIISNGRIYCMQEIMSAYRYVTNEGSSHTATYRYDYKKEKEYFLALIEYAYHINNQKSIYCAEIIYAFDIMRSIKRRYVSIIEGLKDLISINHKLIIIKALLQKIFFNWVSLN